MIVFVSVVTLDYDMKFLHCDFALVNFRATAIRRAGIPSKQHVQFDKTLTRLIDQENTDKARKVCFVVGYHYMRLAVGVRMRVTW